jgi:hypothetical protein
MGKPYSDTLVLGASFLGIGAALTVDDCVVIESGGLFGAEFVNSYKVNNPEKISLKSGLGMAFFADLKKRSLVYDDSEVYQAPAVYVLSQFLKEKALDIRLMTDVIKIEKADGLFCLTLHNMKGFDQIKTKKIIDTTTLGKGHKKAGNTSMSKCLNAIIYNPSGSELPGLSYNRARDLYTYSLPVDSSCSRHDAIEKLCAMEKQFLDKDMKISSIAPEFSYSMYLISEKIEHGFLWYPSAARANLVAAFEDGVVLGESNDPE